MGILSGLFRSRDKPTDRTAGSSYSFFLGGTSSGKYVTERSAMQMTAVYCCVRILSEAVASLPLQFYRYTDDGGKEKAVDHPLYFLLHELTTALMNAKDGDTILVGDITFQPMPMGMIIVPKNVTIKSGKDTNAVFTNATFALNGTTTDSAPLTVKFENIDFRGDQSGTLIDPNSPPLISSAMPDIMKTMYWQLQRLS